MHLFVDKELAIAVGLINWQIPCLADRKWGDYIVVVTPLEEQNLTIWFNRSVLLIVHPEAIYREIAVCFDEKALVIGCGHFK